MESNTDWFEKAKEYNQELADATVENRKLRNLIDRVQEEITISVEDDYYRQKLLKLISDRLDEVL